MNYAESTSILEQFRINHPEVFMIRGVQGIVVIQEDAGFVLQVRLRPGTKLSAIEKVPETFSYVMGGERKQISARVVESKSLYFQQVRAGDSAQPAGSMYMGTAGWSIYLDGVLVCLSNWHVLCSLGNSTPIGQRILLNGQNVASLFAFQPVYFGNVINDWDYALAAYDSRDDVVGEMRSCDDGSKFPYPQKLSTAIEIGETYRKDGAGPGAPICRTGTLLGVGTIQVSYDEQGGNAWFENQLLFSGMTVRGDSGAVIVRVADNTVTGLNFAGPLNGTETWANPILYAGWISDGVRELANGVRIPMFVTNGSAIGAAVQQVWPEREQLQRHPDVPLAKTAYPAHSDPRKLKAMDGIPSLGGRLFLGMGTAIIRAGSGLSNVNGAPPPVSNNPVVTVPLGPLNWEDATHSPDSLRINVAFFG